MAACQGKRLEVREDFVHHRKAKSACSSTRTSPRMDGKSLHASSCPATPLQKGGTKTRALAKVSNSRKDGQGGGSSTFHTNIKPGYSISDPSSTKVQVRPSRQRPEVTVMDETDKPDLGRIRNYQIKSIKRGVPTFDPKDSTVQRILMKKRDLKISRHWICQQRKEGMDRNATSWAFSTLVIFLCLVFPLLSFSSDVAFYVTCSDHYNHTAQILEKVRQNNEANIRADENTTPRTRKVPEPNSGIRTQDTRTLDGADEWQPAPIRLKGKRSLFDKGLDQDWAIPITANQDSLIRVQENYYEKQISQGVYPVNSPRASHDAYVTKSSDPLNPRVKNKEKKNMLWKEAQPSLRGTNFEFEVQEYNETSCAPVKHVLSYMLTTKAAEELEAHRHITIDIFEPVFIIGSFPSLILCILTRLVVLVTGHKNFPSAYFVNVACMPLQLITGALSVHSASYHLGKKGFECWNCALQGDCSHMAPLWWLHDSVTKTLLVSILTKILDGIAGGVVLFVVIIRLLWPEGGHATFWWNTIRGFVIFAAFLSCITVSPLLVITPAMSVLKLEFMELATPFPGRQTISLALTVIMILGHVAWGLSFAILFIYIAYSMYLYCRARTIDE